MRLLELLRRLEHLPADDSDRNPLKFCPECCAQQPRHESWCELKAAIDAFSAVENDTESQKYLELVRRL